MSMLRRTTLDISRRRLWNLKRFPRQITAQSALSREFATKPESKNAYPPPNSSGEPPRSDGISPKVVFGTVAIGMAAAGAYSTGYFHRYFIKETPPEVKVGADEKSFDQLIKESDGSHKSLNVGDTIPVDTDQLLESINADLQHDDKTAEAKSPLPPSEGISLSQSEATTKESDTHNQVEESLTTSFASGDVKDAKDNADNLPKESVMQTPEKVARQEKPEDAESASTLSSVTSTSTENISQATPSEHPSPDYKPLDVQSDEKGSRNSLLDEYNLKDEGESRTSGAEQKILEAVDTLEKKASLGPSLDLDDAYISKDGKLILDFLQAIHAAEQRQAELDAQIYSEELRNLKQIFGKELKDARARELRYAEESGMLEKELEKERAKAAATIKSLQEKAEERLIQGLEEKERETEMKLNEAQEFAKAELAASIAREKAAQLEKMQEANLNINALCMAFYARSEEARQSHSIHNLALGALALEDALSKGQPIQDEVNMLRTYLEVVDKDSLLDLALSSLPEEIRCRGTETPLQLNQKFDELKGKLRHFSLIPRGGGGILAHSLASIASTLKVKEGNKSGDGIESVINRVESLLAEGKLAEAADTLEKGVQNSEACGVVLEWVRQARNRAITEQALTLLQSYALSISLS